MPLLEHYTDATIFLAFQRYHFIQAEKKRDLLGNLRTAAPIVPHCGHDFAEKVLSTVYIASFLELLHVSLVIISVFQTSGSYIVMLLPCCSNDAIILEVEVESARVCHHPVEQVVH